MSVMLGCQIKDAGLWLKRYIGQMEALDCDPMRVVCMYGESTDDTYATLKHWSRISRHRVEIYREPYLPEDERHGWSLARIKREFQQLFDEDYFFLCDPDVVGIPPNTLKKLMADGKDVVAPYVWTEGRLRKTFFDTYGFRVNANIQDTIVQCMFMPWEPFGCDKSEPVEVFSVGSCYLASKKAFKEGVFSNPFPHIQFCLSLANKGIKTFADPRISITHVDLEKYGIMHYPPDIGWTHSPFIDSRGVAWPPEAVGRMGALERKQDYQAYLEENVQGDVGFAKDFDGKRPLLTACYKVFNESEYLKWSLDSVYPYVDRINIVEGAVEKNLGYAGKGGASLDGTVDTVKLYPDPDKKIRLVQGTWRSKEHAQQKLLELCESRWMLYIDGDEAYTSKGMEQIRAFCSENLDGKVVYADGEKTVNYWHDWKHYTYSLNKLSPWNQDQPMHPMLIWRDTEGLNFGPWHTYAYDFVGRNLSLSPDYEERRVAILGITLHHYGHAKNGESTRRKLEYFKARGTAEVQGTVDEDMWFSGKMPSDFVIRDYEGETPESMQTHPMNGITLIEVTSKSPVYQFRRLQ